MQADEESISRTAIEVVRERCSLQYVLNAAIRPRYLSNLDWTGLSTAASATAP